MFAKALFGKSKVKPKQRKGREGALAVGTGSGEIGGGCGGVGGSGRTGEGAWAGSGRLSLSRESSHTSSSFEYDRRSLFGGGGGSGGGGVPFPSSSTSPTSPPSPFTRQHSSRASLLLPDLAEDDDDWDTHPIYLRLSRDPTLRTVWRDTRLVVLPPRANVASWFWDGAEDSAEEAKRAFVVRHAFAPSPLFKDNYVDVLTLSIAKSPSQPSTPLLSPGTAPPTAPTSLLPTSVGVTYSPPAPVLTVTLTTPSSSSVPTPHPDSSQNNNNPFVFTSAPPTVSSSHDLTVVSSTDVYGEGGHPGKVKVLCVDGPVVHDPSALLAAETLGFSSTLAETSFDSGPSTLGRRGSSCSSRHRRPILHRFPHSSSSLVSLSSVSLGPPPLSSLIPEQRLFARDLHLLSSPPPALAPLARAFAATLDFFRAESVTFAETFVFVPDYEIQTARRLRTGLLDRAWDVMRRAVEREDDAQEWSGAAEAFATLLAGGRSKLGSVLENIVMGFTHPLVYESIHPRLAPQDTRTNAITSAYRARGLKPHELYPSMPSLSRSALSKAIRTLGRIRPQNGDEEPPWAEDAAQPPAARTPMDCLWAVRGAIEDLAHAVESTGEEEEELVGAVDLHRSSSAVVHTPTPPLRRPSTRSLPPQQTHTAARAITTDTLIPLLAYALVRAEIEDLESLNQFVRSFAFLSGPLESEREGQLSFAMVNLQAAIQFLASDPCSAFVPNPASFIAPVRPVTHSRPPLPSSRSGAMRPPLRPVRQSTGGRPASVYGGGGGWAATTAPVNFGSDFDPNESQNPRAAAATDVGAVKRERRSSLPTGRLLAANSPTPTPEPSPLPPLNPPSAGPREKYFPRTRTMDADESVDFPSADASVSGRTTPAPSTIESGPGGDDTPPARKRTTSLLLGSRQQDQLTIKPQIIVRPPLPRPPSLVVPPASAAAPPGHSSSLNRSNTSASTLARSIGRPAAAEMARSRSDQPAAEQGSRRLSLDGWTALTLFGSSVTTGAGSTSPPPTASRSPPPRWGSRPNSVLSLGSSTGGATDDEAMISSRSSPPPEEPQGSWWTSFVRPRRTSNASTAASSTTSFSPPPSLQRERKNSAAAHQVLASRPLSTPSDDGFARPVDITPLSPRPHSIVSDIGDAIGSSMGPPASTSMSTIRRPVHRRAAASVSVVPSTTSIYDLRPPSTSTTSSSTSSRHNPPRLLRSSGLRSESTRSFTSLGASTVSLDRAGAVLSLPSASSSSSALAALGLRPPDIPSPVIEQPQPVYPVLASPISTSSSSSTTLSKTSSTTVTSPPTPVMRPPPEDALTPPPDDNALLHASSAKDMAYRRSEPALQKRLDALPSPPSSAEGCTSD